jgi:hypothetical protein
MGSVEVERKATEASRSVNPEAMSIDHVHLGRETNDPGSRDDKPVVEEIVCEDRSVAAEVIDVAVGGAVFEDVVQDLGVVAGDDADDDRRGRDLLCGSTLSGEEREEGRRRTLTLAGSSGEKVGRRRGKKNRAVGFRRWFMGLGAPPPSLACERGECSG